MSSSLDYELWTMHGIFTGLLGALVLPLVAFLSLANVFTVTIDKPLLQKIAHLARLEVDADQEAAVLKDLNKIVAWIEKLKEVETTEVQPLFAMSAAQHALQEDVPQAALAHEKALANAPQKDSNYFRVPQVKE